MNTEMTDEQPTTEQPTTEQPTTEAAHEQGTHTPPTPGWRRVPISRVPRGGTDGGKVGGVVAGVSRAYAFDLRTTRIATVVSLLVLPVLWLVYAAAWILLPVSPAQAVSLDVVVRDRRRFPLLVALALVLVVGGIGSLGSWFLFRGAPWGPVLIGIGVLLWVLSDRRRDVPPATSFPPPTAGVSFDAAPASSSSSTTSVPVGPAAVTRERRPRRPIGSIGLGVAALWFGVAAALSGLGWWHAPSLWVLVSGLAIVMAALLASTIVNRSWVLPVPFALLAILLISLCVAQPRLEGGSGDRSVHPTTIAAAEVAQHLAAGRLTLDLRDVPVGVRDVVVHAEVGFGNLEIDVAKDATLQLSTDAGIGGVLLNGRQIMAGVHQRDNRVVGALATSVGTLILDLRVGMGRIDVVQVP